MRGGISYWSPAAAPAAALDLKALADPRIAACSPTVTWAQIEPSRDHYDFSTLASWADAAENVDKPCIVRIRSGNDDGTTCEYPDYISATAKLFVSGSKSFPAWCDPFVATRWSALIAGAGEALAGRPHVIVMATGVWEKFAEMWLPGCSAADQAQWVKIFRSTSGNPKATWADVQADFFGRYMPELHTEWVAAFPGHLGAQGIGFGMCDSAADHPMLKALMVKAASIWGKNGFEVQFNGVNADPGGSSGLTIWAGEHFGPAGDVEQLVVGYQLVGPLTSAAASGTKIAYAKFETVVKNVLVWNPCWLEVQVAQLRQALGLSKATGADAAMATEVARVLTAYADDPRWHDIVFANDELAALRAQLLALQAQRVTVAQEESTALLADEAAAKALADAQASYDAAGAEIVGLDEEIALVLAQIAALGGS